MRALPLIKIHVEPTSQIEFPLPRIVDLAPPRRERDAACARGSEGWNAAVHIFRRAS